MEIAVNILWISSSVIFVAIMAVMVFTLIAGFTDALLRIWKRKGKGEAEDD